MTIWVWWQHLPFSAAAVVAFAPVLCAAIGWHVGLSMGRKRMRRRNARLNSPYFRTMDSDYYRSVK